MAKFRLQEPRRIELRNMEPNFAEGDRRLAMRFWEKGRPTCAGGIALRGTAAGLRTRTNRVSGKSSGNKSAGWQQLRRALDCDPTCTRRSSYHQSSNTHCHCLIRSAGKPTRTGVALPDSQADFCSPLCSFGREMPPLCFAVSRERTRTIE